MTHTAIWHICTQAYKVRAAGPLWVLLSKLDIDVRYKVYRVNGAYWVSVKYGMLSDFK